MPFLVTVITSCSGAPPKDRFGYRIYRTSIVDESSALFKNIPTLKKRVECYMASSGPGVRRIEIFKSRFIMNYYIDDTIIKTCPVSFGINPRGPKLSRDDGCTPEGTYTITSCEPSEAFIFYLSLSYPNREDADRALSSGLISQKDHDRIFRALDAGKAPPQDTALGGDVGIHGQAVFVEHNGSYEFVNKTLGCPAVTNSDITEMYRDFAVKGMTVIIHP